MSYTEYETQWNEIGGDWFKSVEQLVRDAENSLRAEQEGDFIVFHCPVCSQAGLGGDLYREQDLLEHVFEIHPELTSDDNLAEIMSSAEDYNISADVRLMKYRQGKVVK